MTNHDKLDLLLAVAHAHIGSAPVKGGVDHYFRDSGKSVTVHVSDADVHDGRSLHKLAASILKRVC